MFVMFLCISLLKVLAVLARMSRDVRVDLVFNLLVSFLRFIYFGSQSRCGVNAW